MYKSIVTKEKAKGVLLHQHIHAQLINIYLN